jgi:hypothetical protein
MWHSPTVSAKGGKRTVRRFTERLFPETNWYFWLRIEHFGSIYLPQITSRKVKAGHWHSETAQRHLIARPNADY